MKRLKFAALGYLRKLAICSIECVEFSSNSRAFVLFRPFDVGLGGLPRTLRRRDIESEPTRDGFRAAPFQVHRPPCRPRDDVGSPHGAALKVARDPFGPNQTGGCDWRQCSLGRNRPPKVTLNSR